MKKFNPLEIINAPNKDAVLGREMLVWYSPVFGYVEMYINPQSLRVSNNKILTSTRTKAGFVLQYAGEDLTKIAISGTTGSAGAEGINILYNIYRSEHIGFSKIANEMEEEYSAQITNNAIQDITSTVINSLSAGLGTELGVFADATAALGANLSFLNQPFPTLASIAAAIELRFQGVIYKGFFTSFSFEESAASPGLFDYQIEFSSYATMGERRNFMPWHRQPIGPADSSRTDNFSFGNTVSEDTRRLSTPEVQQPTADTFPDFRRKSLSSSKVDLTNSIEFIAATNITKK